MTAVTLPPHPAWTKVPATVSPLGKTDAGIAAAPSSPLGERTRAKRAGEGASSLRRSAAQ